MTADRRDFRSIPPITVVHPTCFSGKFRVDNPFCCRLFRRWPCRIPALMRSGIKHHISRIGTFCRSKAPDALFRQEGERRKKTGSIVVRIKIVRIFALTKLLNKFVNSKRRPFQARGRAARRTGIRRAFRNKRTIFKRRERNGKDNPEQGTGYSAGSRT